MSNRPPRRPPRLELNGPYPAVERLEARRAAARRLRRRRLLALGGLVIITFGIVAAVVALTAGGTSTPHPRSASARRPTVTKRHKQRPTMQKSATHKAPRHRVTKHTPPEPRNTSAPSPLKPNAAASFAAFEHTQPGPIGIAVEQVNGGHEVTLGDDSPAHGWSTTKPLVLASLLNATAAHGGLNETEKSEATAAITISDNQSIIDLFDDLAAIDDGPLGAAKAMETMLRDSGDDQTVVATSTDIPAGASTTFGQTLWAPSQAVKFYASLAHGCLISHVDTDYVLNLMEHIEASESWGLGDAGFDDVAFKGGWGPENGNLDLYLVRQSGIVDPNTPSAAAVSIVAHPPDASDSFETGTAMVTAAAHWLANELTYTKPSNRACHTPTA